MRERISRALRRHAERRGRGYPDWALRYAPVARRLKRLRTDARVLEAGANANGLARFLRRDGIVAVNLSEGELREARAGGAFRAAAADIGRLPFADGTFDACVCMDTFEHLPKAARAGAAAELLRVLKPGGTAVIAFPSGAAAALAEARIREAYRAASGGTLRWLEEHESEGLPDAGELAAQITSLAGSGIRVHVTGNANLRVWEWMWRVLICGWPGRGNALAQVLLYWLTPLLAHLHAPPCYRAVIWIEPGAGRGHE